MPILVTQHTYFTIYFLRGLIFILSCASSIAWIRVIFRDISKYERFLAILKVFACILSAFFVIIVTFNNILYVIEPWFLNTLSNTVRVALISGMLFTELRPRKEVPKEIVEAIDELKEL